MNWGNATKLSEMIYLSVPAGGSNTPRHGHPSMTGPPPKNNLEHTISPTCLREETGENSHGQREMIRTQHRKIQNS